MNSEPTRICRIEARPIDARRCRLVVDQPLLPEHWAFFRGRSDPAIDNAPLIERIFGIPEIESVLVAHDKLTVTRTVSAGLPILGTAISVVRALTGDPAAQVASSWRGTAKKVAGEVRAHRKSGLPVIRDPSRIVVPSTSELKSRIERVLETDVNPVIAGHGGGVSIVGVIDNVVYLRMSGGCQGCGLADMTLKHGVEAAIRDGVPEIGEIIDLTDHAGGLRPFVKSRGDAASPFAGRKRLG